MKKIGFLIFAAALVFGLIFANMFSFGKVSGKFANFSFGFKGVKGSGKTALDVRNVSDFKAVDVGGVFDVEITAQKEFAVEIEADDNLLPLISTEVRNGVLHIGTESKVSPKSRMVVRVSAPDIDHLDVSGAATVALNNIKNSSLGLDTSGASKISISGETASFNADISGATKIDAENLKTIDSNLDASGASSVTVNVSGTLRAAASGASNIRYTGSPTSVEKDSSGGARISAK